MASRVEDYLASSVIEQIKEAIQDAENNEVFFVGKTNDENIVEKIMVVARGNEFAVPLVRELTERSDVVIHNHPSGILTPSRNDLNISIELSNFGIASYIVNNSVTKIYVLIEPFSKSKKVLIDGEKLCQTLSPGGMVSKKLPRYEYRPQQLEMISHVSEAFNQEKIAVIEAGTGVGKSMAYLIPAIYWSIQNNERCVVSTNTINLQEQLINKDIPFLQKTLGVKFSAILVKGRSNYICLRKLYSLQQNQDSLFPDTDMQEIHSLVEWSRVTNDGSKSDLNYMPGKNVWEQVCAESDNCLRSFCPHFKVCFVYKAKRRASQANILVVNHHLLFSDLSVRNMGLEVAVLPKYHHIIFDEAHNIEDIATDYFGFGVTRTGINRILHRLQNKKDGRNVGYLNSLIKKLTVEIKQNQYEKVQKIVDQIQNELLVLSDSLVNYNNDLMQIIFNHLNKTALTQGEEKRIRIDTVDFRTDVWNSDVLANLSSFLNLMKRFLTKLVTMLNSLENIGIELSDEILSTKIDVDSQALRLKAIVESIKQIMLKSDDAHVRWIETKKLGYGKDIVRLKMAPLNISEQMEEMVFESFKTIILTSATLTISGKRNGDEFSYLSNRIGLKNLRPDKVKKVKIPPSFDYRNQVIVTIPTDIPNLNSTDFVAKLSDVIFKALEISGGRAFVLFTSYSLLNKVYNMLESKLARLGIVSLKQGQIARHQLLQKFKTDATSVLFGTDSFWQGVDVEGDALESVIITKLPFKVPTEPIIEARIQAIERNGGNAFMEYSVPQAVLKLKQGFGRLIRKKTDHGAVFLLDKRIVEKFYGRIFLESLPDTKILTGPADTILKNVEQFFQGFTSSVE